MDQFGLKASSFYLRIILLATIGWALTLSPARAREATEQGRGRQAAQPTAARLAPEADDSRWLRPAKNYASTRFSGLDQINTESVKNLTVAWTFCTSINRGHEAVP